jgi:hypothetical protein
MARHAYAKPGSELSVLPEIRESRKKAIIPHNRFQDKLVTDPNRNEETTHPK